MRVFAARRNGSAPDRHIACPYEAVTKLSRQLSAGRWPFTARCGRRMGLKFHAAASERGRDAMRLLLVEDTEDVAEAIGASFARRGDAVDHALTIAEARQTASPCSTTTSAILDIDLPDGMGTEVLRRSARVRGQATPVLMLTARSQDRRPGLGAGRGRGRLSGQALRPARAAGAGARAGRAGSAAGTRGVSGVRRSRVRSRRPRAGHRRCAGR